MTGGPVRAGGSGSCSVSASRRARCFRSGSACGCAISVATSRPATASSRCGSDGSPSASAPSTRILEPGVELTVLTAPGERPPGIQIFRDKLRNRVILHAFRLTPAPAGRAYQLWILPRGGNPIPSRVFNSEADGHALAEGIEVPADVIVDGFAITQEPAGGSPQPTSAILLYGKVALNRSQRSRGLRSQGLETETSDRALRPHRAPNGPAPSRRAARVRSGHPRADSPRAGRGRPDSPAPPAPRNRPRSGGRRIHRPRGSPRPAPHRA